MRTYRDGQGYWNLIDARGVLVRRGTFREVVDALRGLW